jgi:hypothetical protein
MNVQLELFPLPATTCRCGRALTAFINCYRERCDHCILREGPPPAGEDPEAKRVALKRWLNAQV